MGTATARGHYPLLLQHCCNTAATLLQHCCNTVATLLQHCRRSYGGAMDEVIDDW